MTDRFNELLPNPIDPIMIANAQWPDFQLEHPGAINTTIGVLVTPLSSSPWQPNEVRRARENALHDVLEARAFNYQSQSGFEPFLASAGELVFGQDLYFENFDDLLKFQTSGGTGALSLAKDVLQALVKADSNGQIPMVIDSGWPNHPAIFSAPFTLTGYEHMHAETGEYNHQAAIDAFESAPDNAVFLLQTCGYNDDGMDRTQEQWDDILEIAQAKNTVVLLDSAYMGLVKGFDDERYPIEQSIKRNLLTFVSFSASKNMGLYNERLGALFVANARQAVADEQFPLVKQLIAKSVRRTVSSSPITVAKAAGVALRSENYHEELGDARARLTLNRKMFAEVVSEVLPAVGRGGGLFTKVSSDGFTDKQQSSLAEDGIFALPNSRINLGGLHKDQVERVGLAVIRAITNS